VDSARWTSTCVGSSVFGLAPGALGTRCARGGEAEQANPHGTRTRQALGIQPNAVTYNAMLAVAHKAQMWEMALQLYQEMSQKSLTMTVETFNPLIGALSHSYQPRLALDAFAQMQRLEIQVTACPVLCEG
jgi:pentatricopeptide repeat protein